MNIEDLKNSLNELKNKQKDNLIKRRTLIKEMKTMPSARLSRRLKAKDGAVQALVIDVEACKQERAEKQMLLDQQVPEQAKLNTKRILNSTFKNYLQKAKQDLDSQEPKLQKQKEITKRVGEDVQKELQDLKQDFEKRKDTLVQEKKQIEKILAVDEFKRQTILLDLQFKTMEQYFITKSEPHILWKPSKTNEGMNNLKEYSQQKFQVLYSQYNNQGNAQIIKRQTQQIVLRVQQLNVKKESGFISSQ
ncbi:hypothetical protein pb186bvf_006756 [Paramecium bursaria]